MSTGEKQESISRSEVEGFSPSGPRVNNWGIPSLQSAKHDMTVFVQSSVEVFSSTLNNKTCIAISVHMFHCEQAYCRSNNIFYNAIR